MVDRCDRRVIRRMMGGAGSKEKRDSDAGKEEETS
jgi:hypothetical protein